MSEQIAALRAAAEANRHFFAWESDGPVVLATGQVMPGWHNTTPLCVVPHGKLGDFNDEAAQRIAEYIAMCSPERITALLDAFDYAVNIIESYELDMRSVEIDGQTLAERGICQGSIYRDAIASIRRRASKNEGGG